MAQLLHDVGSKFLFTDAVRHFDHADALLFAFDFLHFVAVALIEKVFLVSVKKFVKFVVLIALHFHGQLQVVIVQIDFQVVAGDIVAQKVRPNLVEGSLKHLFENELGLQLQSTVIGRMWLEGYREVVGRGGT